MMVYLFAAIAPVALGGLLLHTVFVMTPRRPGLLLTLTFGPLLGLGLVSVLDFFRRVTAPTSSVGFIEAATIAAMAIVFCLACRHRVRRAPPDSAGVPLPWPIQGVLWGTLLFSAIVALSSALAGWTQAPVGTWDTLVIWGYKARYFHRAGVDWSRLFDGSYDDFAHVYYPLLWPCVVARTWDLIEGESEVVLGLVDFSFAATLPAILVATLTILRSASSGLLAASLLLACTLYLGSLSAQQADLPVACYQAAAAAFALLSTRPDSRALLILSGLSAGLAAWTKNEGILFLACFAPAILIVEHVKDGFAAALRKALLLLVGLTSPLAALLVFKLGYSTAGELLLSGNTEANLSRLLSLERHAYIFPRLVTAFVGASGALPGLGLLAVIVLFGKRSLDRAGHEALGIGAALLAMLLGLQLTYATTPRPLEWQVETSLGRVVFQAWPTWLLVIFSLLRTPEEVWQSSRSPDGHDVGSS